MSFKDMKWKEYSDQANGGTNSLFKGFNEEDLTRLSSMF